MVQDILYTIPRNARRDLLRKEAKARATGDWGSWEIIALPHGISPSGWTGKIRRAMKNKVFAVLIRDCHTDSGVVRHLAISSLSQIRPTWHEAQRIKNEIAGTETTAVEVYPPHSELVDEADMYHLWVLSAPLPFSIYEKNKPFPVSRVSGTTTQGEKNADQKAAD